MDESGSESFIWNAAEWIERIKRPYSDPRANAQSGILSGTAKVEQPAFCVEKPAATIATLGAMGAEQQSANAAQQKEIKALTARVKERATRIQNVNAPIEANQ